MDTGAGADAEGDAALRLARELRSRTQRERVTAQRLREYLEASRAGTGELRLPDAVAGLEDEACLLRQEVRTDDDGVLALHLTVEGEVDVAAARRLQAEVDALVAGTVARRVVLDLDAVSFFDSAGLSWLLHVRRVTVAADRSLVLAAASRAVQRPLNVTGLARLFSAADGARRT